MRSGRNVSNIRVPKTSMNVPLTWWRTESLRERRKSRSKLTYLFQISKWTSENGDHDDGDGDGMLDDDVLFWIWRNLMLCVFPVCHHLF